MRQAYQDLLDLFLPPSCWICGQGSCTDRRFGSSDDDVDGMTPHLPPTTMLCKRCWDELLVCRAPRSCTACGMPLPSDVQQCPHCRDHRFHFEHVFALGVYQEPLRTAVYQIKHPAGWRFAEEMARLVVRIQARTLIEQGFQSVTWVPSHWSRRLNRKCTPALTLAATIANELNLPLHHLLRRCKRTKKQGLLGPAARRRNLDGSFAPKKSYLSRRSRAMTIPSKVLLVDDVLTTGTTCDEASKTLKKLGVGQVSVLVIARATGA